MDNLKIKSVLEAIIIERDNAGKITDAKFFGATTDSSITHDAPVEKLRAGIYNDVKALSYGDKEVKFTITTLLKNSSIIAMKLGKKLAEGTQEVVNAQEYILKSGGKILKADIQNATSVKVLDLNNKVLDTTDATGDLLVTSKLEGDKVIVVYPQSVSGTVVEIGKKDFPKPKEVHLHTIAYEPLTEVVIADIYWIFKNAMPNGAFDEKFAGQNNTQDLEFDALPDNKGNHGYYVVVPRTV